MAYPIIVCLTTSIWCACAGSHEINSHTSRKKALYFRTESTSAVGPALVRQVNISLGHRGRSATVSFTSEGRPYQYHLLLFSVYQAGADAHAHTNHGIEKLDSTSSRTFRSREAGKWAAAVLHADGSVSGLFEDNGHIMEIQPAGILSLASAPALLATNAGKGKDHFMQHFTFEDIFEARRLSENALLSLDHSRAKGNESNYVERPEIAIDEDHEDLLGHHIFEIPEGAPEPHESFGAYNAKKVDEWWPGCFSGDSGYRKFVIGIIADVPAFEAHGEGLQSLIEAAIAEASMVYEKQLHIRLELGSLTVYKNANTAPRYAMCPPDFMADKLEQLRVSPPPFQGAVHLLTGCGDGSGVVGEAFIGTICSTDGSNIAVAQLRGKSSWLTLAHELGHNFAARHSFEQGMGKTGGIMDYGDGRFNDVYQFNTQYRKAEICAKLKSVGSCKGKFLPTDPPPTEAPQPADKGRRRGSRRRRRSKAGQRRRRGSGRRRSASRRRRRRAKR